MRPKKEDWLKKKDRKQRRPGCRRAKNESEGELLPWAPLFHPGEADLCPRERPHHPPLTNPDCPVNLALGLDSYLWFLQHH